jgi:hypothetical protein
MPRQPVPKQDSAQDNPSSLKSGKRNRRAQRGKDT